MWASDRGALARLVDERLCLACRYRERGRERQTERQEVTRPLPSTRPYTRLCWGGVIKKRGDGIGASSEMPGARGALARLADERLHLAYRTSHAPPIIRFGARFSVIRFGVPESELQNGVRSRNV